ncbi:MAG TPA: hypothetical protein VGK32_23385 [Vicinamibacterales bacterium]
MFIVLSLFSLGLFLAGCVPASFSRARGRVLEQVGLAVGLGILIDYCLVLTGQRLTLVLAAGIVLASWGAVRLLRDLAIRRKDGLGRGWMTVATAGLIGALLTVYYLQIVSEPLLRWDARSIWFFHARMIWLEGALRQHTGLAHPSLAFSHPDYPELVPALAAQLAHVRGFWNEFFPKSSLVVMLVPLVFWVFSFHKNSVSFLLLVLVCFFSLDAWLWNGYMDGYLAMYCGIGLLLFGRYLSEGRDTDLYSAMCALGIAACLKNEGLLFVSCFGLALLWMNVGRPRLFVRQVARRLRRDSHLVTVLLLAMAPTVMWTIWRHAWTLQNDLTADVPGSLWRLSSRVADGVSLLHVLDYLVLRATAIWMVAGLLALTAAFSIHQRLTLHHGAILAATTSVLYVCGISIAYMGTPLDLDFHLSTSAGRTMATASMGLLVCLFFLLSDLEAGERPAETATSSSN